MKVFGIIVLILPAVLLPAEAKSSKFGIAGKRDVLLYTKDLITICDKEEECDEVVKFPIPGEINEKTIVFINCQDNLGNTSTVECTSGEGGFGEKKAEVHIKSKKGENVNFVVEIYGKQSLAQ